MYRKKLSKVFTGSGRLPTGFAEGAAKHMEDVMDRTHPHICERVRTESTSSTRYAHGGLVPKHDSVHHQMDAMRYALGSFCVKLTDEEIKKLKERVKKMCADVPHRNWEFTVPHVDAICPAEVTKHIGRENPVAIMCFAGSMVAFVHASIMHKAKIIKDQPWEFNRTNDPSIYAITSNSVSYHDVITWARHIKSATWGGHKKVEGVRVIIPKI